MSAGCLLLLAATHLYLPTDPLLHIQQSSPRHPTPSSVQFHSVGSACWLAIRSVVDSRDRPSVLTDLYMYLYVSPDTSVPRSSRLPLVDLADDQQEYYTIYALLRYQTLHVA